MKPLLLLLLLALVAPLRAADDVQTSAALPNNRQIWPLPEIDLPNTINVKAEFKEQKQICSYTQGNWRTMVYLVSYKVSHPNAKFPHKEITFIAEDTGPADGSGIKMKKLLWPFGKGALTFALEKDASCVYTDFFKILSYNKDN